MYLRSKTEHASEIVVNEFDRTSLPDAEEKAVIILTNKIMKLINLGMAYEFSMFGNDRMILYRTVKIFCSNVLPVIMLNPCSLKD